MTANLIEISQLGKTYQSGHQALKSIDLTIRKGEIFALLGPNGAGKTTLISIVCGIVTRSSGKVLINGVDIAEDFRSARSLIGLVPQELATDAFESVISTVRFSRGLFGKPANPAYLETLMKSLSLWDKRNDRIMSLSGGMKRRLLIAKALSHEPQILFLDEPTAGVDVELRHDMWNMVKKLREQGVTVILTTHYIEEAEEMADRIGIINNGELLLAEDKRTLISQLGKKQLIIELPEQLSVIPSALHEFSLQLSDSKFELIYQFDEHNQQKRISALLNKLNEIGLEFKDIRTQQSSLEDIFVSLLKEQK